MKKELRRRIRSVKSRYSPEELMTMSGNVISQLVNTPAFQQSDTVLLYHSLPDEVYTHKLIREACKTKTILLPSVCGEELELHVYCETDSVHKGHFDIIESDGELFNDYHKIELAVIPGVAFDEEGHRLGRGKGYYDRLLPLLSCPLIGICFPFQILDFIPSEPHDQKVDMVLH